MKDTKSTLRSGALASLAGVSTDTLRYYERRGLLPQPPRDANGYRRYPQAALMRVRVVQQALDAGFTVEDLAARPQTARRGRRAVPRSLPHRSNATRRARPADRRAVGASRPLRPRRRPMGGTARRHATRPSGGLARRARHGAARCPRSPAAPAASEAHSPLTREARLSSHGPAKPDTVREPRRYEPRAASREPRET